MHPRTLKPVVFLTTFLIVFFIAVVLWRLIVAGYQLNRTIIHYMGISILPSWGGMYP